MKPLGSFEEPGCRTVFLPGTRNHATLSVDQRLRRGAGSIRCLPALPLTYLGILFLCERAGPVSTFLALSIGICALGFLPTLQFLSGPDRRRGAQTSRYWFVLGWLLLVLTPRVPA